MTDIARAQLGRTKSGLQIGYKLLDLSRNTLSPFTRQNVVETSIAGNYVVSGGVDFPPSGGYIVWGTETQDIAEAGFEPEEPPSMSNEDVVLVLWRRIEAALNELYARIVAVMPGTPQISMDTSRFDAGMQSMSELVQSLHKNVSELIETGHQLQAEQVAEINRHLGVIVAEVDKLRTIEQAAAASETIVRMRDVLENLIPINRQVPVIQMMSSDPQLTATVDRLAELAQVLSGKTPEVKVEVIRDGENLQLVQQLEQVRAEMERIKPQKDERIDKLLSLTNETLRQMGVQP